MISDGLRVRVGPHPDDLCLVEELSIGDSVWDIVAGRLVDIEAMACATLAGDSLADMGLHPMPVQAEGGNAYLALASSRMLQRTGPVASTDRPRVFFRLWPESRLIAEVEGRPVLFRSA